MNGGGGGAETKTRWWPRSEIARPFDGGVGRIGYLESFVGSSPPFWIKLPPAATPRNTKTEKREKRERERERERDKGSGAPELRGLPATRERGHDPGWNQWMCISTRGFSVDVRAAGKS